MGLPDSGTRLDIWPGLPPGTPADMPPERVTDDSTDPFLPRRGVDTISRPTLTVMRPERPNGSAVIVAPGSGYLRIAMDVEGRDIASWLNGLGITALLMTYRLPAEGHANGRDVPMQDAQRALRLVRARAPEWGLDSTRIGILAASAGGHMAAAVIAQPERTFYAPSDDIDALPARPDFSLLLYPVISMEDGPAHEGSRQRLIGNAPSAEERASYSPDRMLEPGAAECFILHADDDPAVPSENAILFYQALKRSGTPAELHILRDGGHGFGIARTGTTAAADWPALAAAWLRRIGMA